MLKFLDKYFNNYLLIGENIGNKKEKFTNKDSKDILLKKNQEGIINLKFSPNGDLALNKNIVEPTNINSKNGMFYYIVCGISKKDTQLFIEGSSFHGLQYIFYIDTCYINYFFFKLSEKDIYRINYDIGTAKIKKIFETIKDLLGIEYGITVGKTSFIPAPLSIQYYKVKGKVIQYNVKVVLNKEYEDIDYPTMVSYSKYIEDKKEEKKIEGNLIYKYGPEIIKTINTMKFEDILKQVKKYKDIELLDYNVLNLKLPNGDVIDKGYIYNEITKTVNYFYKKHFVGLNIPRGSLSVFLYYAMGKNGVRFEDFVLSIPSLKNKFVDTSKEKTLKTIDCIDYIIVFTNRNVYIQTNENKTVVKTLFRDKMIPLGRGKASVYKNGFEFEGDIEVFVFEIRGEKVMIKAESNKSKFNSLYNATSFFYGIDNDLGMFFNGLKRFGGLPEYKIYTKNGIFDNRIILGGKLYLEVDEDKNNNTLFFIEEKYDLFDGKQITVKKAFELFRKLYHDELSVIVFLEVLALAGMNLWKNSINPGLLLTGETGSGKSTISDMMRGLLGYAFNSRRKSLSGITPQPLHVAVNDNSILFLEELTNDINYKVEEALREIINRTSGGRGSINGNIVYQNNSPLFITGERSFNGKSINNRFVITNVDKKHRRLKGQEGKRIINQLFSSCMGYDLYKTYIYKSDLINITYKKATEILIEHIGARHADVYGYVYAMNEIFDLGIKSSKLIEIIKDSLKSAGFLNDIEFADSFVELDKLLIKGAIKKKLYIDVVDGENGEIHYNIIFIEDKYLEENRVKFRAIFNDIKNKYKQFEKRFNITHDSISIEIRTTYAEEFDLKLSQMLTKAVRLSGNRSF